MFKVFLSVDSGLINKVIPINLFRPRLNMHKMINSGITTHVTTVLSNNMKKTFAFRHLPFLPFSAMVL